ncbi:CHASE3 domain-containing protein [Gemmata sp. JC673]|uniref:CHASE3 domain-containing protein n=1 Tax=Gemmata algarum TaxID=2975278 RepID=A0ABU5F8M0_9BACT|nr:CHASE3 domain-containing protein [Gemmata algarum]MDY3563142.1 CHASE3 domain-containing protein [Gemmata algarum]
MTLTHPTPLARLAGLADRNFLPLLLAAYVLAVVAPGPGCRLCRCELGAVAAVRATPPVILLAVLLWNAGVCTPVGQFRQLLRRPWVLGAGLAANVVAPLLFVAALAGVLRLWSDPGDLAALLMGLGVVASMPIAGSATAWAKKAEGDSALSLGLVLGSTLLGPLTTPAVLFGVSLFLSGDDANALRALATGGGGAFLFLAVLLPTAAGLLTRRLVPDLPERAGPALKVLNAVVLLALVYSGASAALDATLGKASPDFLAAMLGVAVSFCGVAFAAGWLVGRLTGATPGERTALLFGLGMSNNGSGLALAATALAGRPQVLLLVAGYNLVQHLVAGGVDAARKRLPPTGSAAAESRWALLRPVASFGFALAAGAVVAAACGSYFGVRGLADTHRQVVHTHEVLTEVRDTLSLLKDAETGQRGYLLTGDAKYLEPYDAAVAQVRQRFRRLRALTADNADQQERLGALERVTAVRLGELDETIRLRREAGFEAARRVVVEDRGKNLMDEVRRLTGEMEAAEQGLLEARAEAADARVRRSGGTVILLAAFAVLSVALRRFDAARESKS